jgi:glyoxylase-like metal-dependent hydrolase (beta-lactamase superfamily II)
MFTVDSAQMIRGSTGQIEVPAPVYLIEHPKGLVVFDTSLTPLAYEDPYSAYGELATRLQMKTKPSQRPDRQLAELGYRAGDVSRVVISHLHFDHAGGVSLFPDAKLFVGSGEFELAYWPPPLQAGVYRREDLDATRAYDVFYVPGQDVDVFDDGSVTILWTPGHTAGELSLFVRLPHRNVILTGDTAHSRRQLEDRTSFYLDTDAGAAVTSLDRLRVLSETTGAMVWISHDKDDWAGHPHAPAFIA